LSADALGERRVLEGVDWQDHISRIAEMLVRTDGALAVLFDQTPGHSSITTRSCNDPSATIRCMSRRRQIDLPAPYGHANPAVRPGPDGLTSSSCAWPHQMLPRKRERGTTS